MFFCSLKTLCFNPSSWRVWVKMEQSRRREKPWLDFLWRWPARCKWKVNVTTMWAANKWKWKCKKSKWKRKKRKGKKNQCHRPQHERRQCHNAMECKKEKEINTRHQNRKVSRKRYNTIARKREFKWPHTLKCKKINVHTKMFVYVVTNPLFGRWLVAIPQSSNPGIGFHPLHPPHFTRVHGMDFTNIFKNQVLVFISHSFQPICFTSVKLKLNCQKSWNVE